MHLETEKHQKPRGAHKFWLEFWYTGKSDKIQNIVTCPFLHKASTLEHRS